MYGANQPFLREMLSLHKLLQWTCAGQSCNGSCFPSFPALHCTHAGIKYYARYGLTDSEVDDILSFTLSAADADVVSF